MVRIGPAVAGSLLAWSAVHPRAPAPRAAAAAPPGSRPARIVLVDGHNGMRSGVQGFLTKSGFQCDAYADAAEALAAMVAAPPDLVVTETALPSMDGCQLLNRIKSDATLCGVPVVLLCGRGMTSDRIAGFRAGAAAYLSKPFDPEELLAVINAQLSNAILLQSSGVGLDVQTELRQIRQEMASVRQLLQVMLQLQARAAATGGSVDAPKLPKGYPAKVPLAFHQATVKKFIPPGSSNWRGNTRGEWWAHVKPYSRVVRRVSDYESETDCILAALQESWRQFNEKSGLMPTACLVEGIF